MNTKEMAFWITNALFIVIAIFILSKTEIQIDFNTIMFTISILLFSTVGNRIYGKYELKKTERVGGKDVIK